MYEGFLQHDAQEVLQCILGYMQEACDTMRKEHELYREDNNSEVKSENGTHPGSSSSVAEPNTLPEEENQLSGKRKSDTEVGNAKKKPKSAKSKKSDSEDEARNKPLTRSKRRSSSGIVSDSNQGKDGEGEAGDEGRKKLHAEEEEEEEVGESDSEGKGKKASKEADGKKKKKAKLKWLRPSGKQPSIFSKFRSVGKISCSTAKNQSKLEQENGPSQEEKTSEERPPQNLAEDKKAVKHQGRSLLLLDKWNTFVRLNERYVY